jgi:hypothetical protein
MTRKLLVLMLCLPLFSCQSGSLAPQGRSVSEFRQLKVAEGDYAFGYHNVAGATNAAQVIDKFGNPSRTEDLSDFYKCKVFYYPGKDDFGNACMVKLQFVPACQTGINCYGLVSVSTEAK